MTEREKETIQEKARRLFGDPVDLRRFLRAIADKLWSPQDARELKATREAVNNAGKD